MSWADGDIDDVNGNRPECKPMSQKCLNCVHGHDDGPLTLDLIDRDEVPDEVVSGQPYPA